jgi:hypothetical protein
MNSFSELNSVSNELISYTDQSEAVVVFGANAGNVTLTPNESSSFVFPKQANLVTATNPIYDIAIQYTANTAASINSIAYVGPSGNISVGRTSSTLWRVGGVRTVADYNEAFANVRCLLAIDATANLTITTTVSDQLNQVLNWTNTVNIQAFNNFTLPGTFFTVEDSAGIDITGISITDPADVDYPTTYTVILSLASEDQGDIEIDSVSAVSHTLTDTRANLNAKLATTRYIPAADFSGDAPISYTQIRNLDSVTQANQLPILIVVSPSDEYAVESSVQFEPGLRSVIPTQIIDAAVGKNYTVSMTLANAAVGNLFLNTTNSGNLISVSGNRATVNTALNTVSFVGTQFTNTNIQYQQIQTTDSITQANIAQPVLTLSTSGIVGPTSTLSGTLAGPELITAVTTGNVMPSGFNWFTATDRGETDNIPREYAAQSPYVPVSATTPVKVGTRSVGFNTGGIVPGPLGRRDPVLIGRWNPSEFDLVDLQPGTIEMWMYLPAGNTNGTLYFAGRLSNNILGLTGDTGFFPNIGVSSDNLGAFNKIVVTYNNKPVLVDQTYQSGRSIAHMQSASLATATWHHVAVTVDTTREVKLFVNGSTSGVVKYTSGPSYAAPGGTYGSIVDNWYASYNGTSNFGVFGVLIGTSPVNTFGSALGYSFGGYMDEIRLSNSVRYTTTFTPATTRHVVDANTVAIVRSITSDV